MRAPRPRLCFGVALAVATTVLLTLYAGVTWLSGVPVLRLRVPGPTAAITPPRRVLVATLLTHEPYPNTLSTVTPLLLALLRVALGVPVTLVPVRDVALADICIVSQYGPTSTLRSAVQAARERSNATIFVFFALENPESWGAEDGLVDIVDVSFGIARCNATPGAAAALGSSKYLHTPVWLAGALRLELVRQGRGESETGSGSAPRSPAKVLVCSLHEGLSTPVDPDEWASRPRFAAMVASHGGYPRENLADYVTSVAEELSAASSRARLQALNWRVDFPGQFRRNLGPDALPPGADKVAFLQQYRFNVQPENSRSRAGGYTTEKVLHALLAGTVPVTWGDAPEPEVFNPARILTLEEDGSGEAGCGAATGGLEPADLMARVRSLESDARARAAFFAEPVLLPGAGAWVRRWCDAGARILRRAIERHPVVGPRLLNPT